MDPSVWQGILRWSLSQTDESTGASQPSGNDDNVHPLSSEDADFLEKAILANTIDETARIKICVAFLRLPTERDEIATMMREKDDWRKMLNEVNPGVQEGQSVGIPASATRHEERKKRKGGQAADTGEEKKEADRVAQAESSSSANQYSVLPEESLDSLRSELIAKKAGALDELDERVLTSDNAVDFHIVGGFPPLFALLNSPHPSLQWRAAQVLATVCQNNPRCQEWATEEGAIEKLLKMLRIIDSEHEERWLVVTKALYALSSILRSETAAVSQLVHQFQGTEQISRVLADQQAPTRVKTKALSLLRFLLSRPFVVDFLSSRPDFLRGLISNIGSDDLNLREEAMRLVNSLAAASSQSLHALKQPQLGLADRLNARQKEIESISDRDDQLTAEEEKKLIESTGRAIERGWAGNEQTVEERLNAPMIPALAPPQSDQPANSAPLLLLGK